jgi:predicted permease
MVLATPSTVDTLQQDVRYALRAFFKAPAFTTVALVTIATGIGANATVFSFVNALLLRPAAGVEAPASLVSVFTSDYSSGPYGSTSFPDYLSIKREAPAFRELVAFADRPVALMRLGDGVERVRTIAVTGDFFDVLGVKTVAGRALQPGDATPDAPPVAMIGYSLWQRAFAGSPVAIGSPVTLNGEPRTIVGILPAEFTGLNLGNPYEFWTPLIGTDTAEGRENRGLQVVGRLARGASLTQAQVQLDGIAARLAAAYPKSNLGTLGHPDRPRPLTVLRHTRLPPDFRGQVAMIGGVLMAAVGLVLLIACANVAGLLLSRATARGREVAVRLALGASRRRILRQMLTESVILGAAGGGLGLLFALWTADVLPSFFPAEQARLLDARVDMPVVLFTAAIGLLSGLIFGLAPALQGLRMPTMAVLRSATAGAGDGRGLRARKLLVVGQVAVASILLVSAALLTRSLSNAMDADLGYTARQAVLSSIELPADLPEPQGLAYYERMLQDVRTIPGVKAAGLARFVPVAGLGRRGFTMQGYVPRPGEDRELHYNIVDPGYFATMGITALRGRVLQPADSGGRPVAVVNHVLADRYFDGNAVGRTITDSYGLEMEIIGVVRAVRRLDLQDATLPVVFYPIDHQYSARSIVVATTAGDARALTDVVRRRIAAVDRNVAVYRTMTLAAHLDEALSANRLTVALVNACGVMALALAIVGLYGIVAYAVVRRTREIGVRVALGATPVQILRLLIGESGRVVAFGVAAGVLGAFVAARLLTSMLYGVSATDPATFLLVPAAVAALAITASCLPALRALRVNPVAALRHE